MHHPGPHPSHFLANHNSLPLVNSNQITPHARGDGARPRGRRLRFANALWATVLSHFISTPTIHLLVPALAHDRPPSALRFSSSHPAPACGEHRCLRRNDISRLPPPPPPPAHSTSALTGRAAPPAAPGPLGVVRPLRERTRAGHTSPPRPPREIALSQPHSINDANHGGMPFVTGIGLGPWRAETDCMTDPRGRGRLLHHLLAGGDGHPRTTDAEPRADAYWHLTQAVILWAARDAGLERCCKLPAPSPLVRLG
ncbi:hypothetical protein AcV7_009820 [Taiwanofungus camphoratus]|nr:hypothetical protein AcV7_009820 [Antrodia cinnamomea]